MFHSILGGTLFSQIVYPRRLSPFVFHGLFLFAAPGLCPNCVLYVLYLVGMTTKITKIKIDILVTIRKPVRFIRILLEIFKKWHKLLVLSLSLFSDNITLLNFTIPKH
jgi:hypothetical protein